MSEYNIYPTLHSISPFFSRFIIWYMALSINFFLLNQSPDIYTLVTGSSEWLFKGQPPPPPLARHEDTKPPEWGRRCGPDLRQSGSWSRPLLSQWAAWSSAPSPLPQTGSWPPTRPPPVTTPPPSPLPGTRGRESGGRGDCRPVIGWQWSRAGWWLVTPCSCSGGLTPTPSFLCLMVLLLY